MKKIKLGSAILGMCLIGATNTYASDINTEGVVPESQEVEIIDELPVESFVNSDEEVVTPVTEENITVEATDEAIIPEEVVVEEKEDSIEDIKQKTVISEPVIEEVVPEAVVNYEAASEQAKDPNELISEAREMIYQLYRDGILNDDVLNYLLIALYSIESEEAYYDFIEQVEAMLAEFLEETPELPDYEVDPDDFISAGRNEIYQWYLDGLFDDEELNILLVLLYSIEEEEDYEDFMAQLRELVADLIADSEEIEEPIKPVEPAEPVEPELPETPKPYIPEVVSVKPVSIVKDNKEVLTKPVLKQTSIKELPQTGESNNLKPIVLGSFMVGVASFVVYFRKKKV